MTAKIKSTSVPMQRKCMCCRELFMSEGIHNRLCEACKSGDTGIDCGVSGYGGNTTGFNHSRNTANETDLEF